MLRWMWMVGTRGVEAFGGHDFCAPRLVAIGYHKRAWSHPLNGRFLNWRLVVSTLEGLQYQLALHSFLPT